MLDGRLRTTVQRGLEPIGRGLHRARVNPDALTLLGLVFSVVTAFLIAHGRLGWAVVGIACTGVPDILDGTVARHSGRSSPRGAFFDSVCDRVSDAVLLGGAAWYLADESSYLPILALAAVGLSMLISYERAKAEALGYSAKGGLMERAERLVLLAVGLAFDVLVPVLWLMVVLSAITAVHRFVMVWRQAAAPPPLAPRPPRARGPRAGVGNGRGREAGRARHVRRAAPRDDEASGRLAGWWATQRDRNGERRRDRAGGRLPRRTRP